MPHHVTIARGCFGAWQSCTVGPRYACAVRYGSACAFARCRASVVGPLSTWTVVLLWIRSSGSAMSCGASGERSTAVTAQPSRRSACGR
eukprot:2884031-Pleurochrysis_carterae.AAC.3